MRTLTKFLGTLFFFVGLVLLMWCYDNTQETLALTVLTGFAGVLIMAVGLITWLWDEPIDDLDEDYNTKHK